MSTTITILGGVGLFLLCVAINDRRPQKALRFAPCSQDHGSPFSKAFRSTAPVF